MKVLAIIPARGGSKGVPRKNIKPLLDKPLIAYTIEAALRSSHIDRVVVSTDDDEIARASREFGAEVPFMRPKELGRDDTPSVDVFIHAIERLRELENYYPDIVSVLEPTSPFRRTGHIDATIEKLMEKRPGSVVTVCRVERKPSNIHRIIDHDRLVPYIESPKDNFSRRQDWNHLRRVNSAVYTVWADILNGKGKLIDDPCLMVEMDDQQSLNIDTELDFELAEMLLRKGLES